MVNALDGTTGRTAAPTTEVEQPDGLAEKLDQHEEAGHGVNDDVEREKAPDGGREGHEEQRVVGKVRVRRAFVGKKLVEVAVPGARVPEFLQIFI